MSLTIKTTGIEDWLDGGEAYVKALIMGPPSAGKTRSASFWPKPIFADCEKGRMSIADRKVPYGEITSQQDMRDLIRALRVECMKPVASRKYQTLVIDTLDAYQRIVIQERLTAERKESMSGWEDWGYLDTKMSAFVAALLSLPMNIVVNLHVKDSKGDDKDGPSITGPKLKGDLKDQIAGDFDLVGLMGVHYVAEGGERVLKRSIKWHPEPSAPILKDRSGLLPRYTDVNFTEEDYTGLFLPLTDALDQLAASVDLETLETDADYKAEVVAPSQGTAVAQPAAAPVKRAAPAKKAAPAAPAPAVAPVTPAATVASPVAAVPPAQKPTVPAAKRPTLEVVDKGGADPAPVGSAANPEPLPEEVPAGVDPTTGVIEEPFVDSSEAGPDVTEDAALETVAEELGAQVKQEIIHPEETPPAAPAPPAPTTPVPGSRTCGTPGMQAGQLNSDPVAGCGKDLSDEKPDLVNISFIKTSRQKRPTYLCPACMAAHTAASA